MIAGAKEFKDVFGTELETGPIVRPEPDIYFVARLTSSAVVKLKKIRNCAIFDKSTKLSGVLAYGMKFIFRGGGIKFFDLGGPCGPFYGFP